MKMALDGRMRPSRRTVQRSILVNTVTGKSRRRKKRWF